MNAFWQFLKDSMSEDANYPSSIRVNIFIAFTQWGMAITFGFIYCILFYPYLITTYLGSLSALIIFLFGLKVYQRTKAENMPPESKL